MTQVQKPTAAWLFGKAPVRISVVHLPADADPRTFKSGTPEAASKDLAQYAESKINATHMKYSRDLRPFEPTIVVGGLGGSGTRLIAEILSALGYDMGLDLNEASDNLAFTLLFKHLGVLDSSDAEFDALLSVMGKGMGRQGPLANDVEGGARSSRCDSCELIGTCSRLGGHCGGLTPKEERLVLRLALSPSTTIDRPENVQWLADRAVRLLHHARCGSSPTGESRCCSRSGSNMSKVGVEDSHIKWGWKEPNSHVVLDRLILRFGKMKYASSFLLFFN